MMRKPMRNPFVVQRTRVSDRHPRNEDCFATFADANAYAQELEEACRRDWIVVKDMSKNDVIVGQSGAAR